MEIERIYYRIGSEEMQRSLQDRAKAGMPTALELCAINIQCNNEYFVEELETITLRGNDYCEKRLRELMEDYVKRCSRDNGGTPHLLEYYIDWLDNTRLILNGKHSTIDEWCKKYKEWITNYFENKKKSMIAQVQQVEADNDGREQIKKIINEEALKNYFTATFKGAGNNGFNYFDYLIEDIKKVRTPKDAARMALLIYESDKMIKTRKPNTFKEWHRLFCDMTGYTYNSDYKPSKLDINKMKSKLSYL